MPNRILKESICTSENLNDLSAFEETFFYRLIVNVDDYGRMDARPKILASRLFPLKDIRAKQVEDALRALSSAELIELYTVDGRSFLQMKAWDRHQTPRAKTSKYPGPEESVNTSASICKQMQADENICEQMQADAPDIRYSIFDNRYSDSSNISLAHSGGETAAQKAAKTIDAKKKFEIFWSAYPRKVGKGKAETKFLSIKPSDDLFAKMMSALNACKKSEQWTRDGGQYIPYPATWLHQRRWDDEDSIEVENGGGRQNIFARLQEEERRRNGYYDAR